MLSGHPGVAPDFANRGGNNYAGRVWVFDGDIRSGAERVFSFKTLLASRSPHWRLDLWSIRKSQSLCRAHGDAGPDSLGFRTHLPRSRSAKSLCRAGSDADGQHYFSVRIERRHAGLCGTSRLIVGNCHLAEEGPPERNGGIGYFADSRSGTAGLAGRQRTLQTPCQHTRRYANRNLRRNEIRYRSRRVEDVRSQAGFRLGTGSFPDVYPQFRSFHTNFFINEAHNDYLQLLVEMGALGFVTMVWFMWTVFRKGTKKLANWTENTNGAVALAAILGITGILVHSFVDFNLQVPANAALFYVLCAIAAMEPRFGMSRRRVKRRREILTDAFIEAETGTTDSG